MVAARERKDFAGALLRRKKVPAAKGLGRMPDRD